MTEKKTLSVADFKEAAVYGCGLENRDPQRGYQKAVPVQETPIAAILNAKEAVVRTPDLEKDR